MVRPLCRLLEALRSWGWRPGRRALWLLPLLAASLDLYWPSITLARPSATATASISSGNPAPSSPYVVGGLILSGALLALYGFLRAMRSHDWPDLGDVFKIVVATTALTAGVRLMVVAISANNLGPFESQDRVFIPLAGLALILISAKEIVTVMQEGCRAVATSTQADPREAATLAKDLGGK